MTRLTLASSFAVLLMLTACDNSGPLLTSDKEGCFHRGGIAWSYHGGCIFQNPEMK